MGLLNIVQSCNRVLKEVEKLPFKGIQVVQVTCNENFCFLSLSFTQMRVVISIMNNFKDPDFLAHSLGGLSFLLVLIMNTQAFYNCSS